MSRNSSEKPSNGRSRQSSEKTRQSQPPASKNAARPIPSSAPSGPAVSTVSQPAAAPVMTPPPAAPAARSSGATAAALVAVSSRKAAPSQEQIAARAKAIWMKSGCQSGRDAENWLEAERQLRQETTRQ